MSQQDTASKSLLGKSTPYCAQYDPTLLFPIPRLEKRVELGIDENALPFNGVDHWTGYEVSWLNAKGKPIIVIAEFLFPAQSPNIIESKSFKLYLNSFNGSRFDDELVVQAVMEKDLSNAAGAEVSVKFYSLQHTQTLGFSLPGTNIDGLDVNVDDYSVNPSLLQTVSEGEEVSETINSHLLKSNCLVTAQPDWGSVVIRYQGNRIDHEGVLKYLISFREHNEFHEQCVERIFMDIMKQCRPSKLTVYARYVRRGGLDINPYRSNYESCFDFTRTIRQ